MNMETYIICNEIDIIQVNVQNYTILCSVVLGLFLKTYFFSWIVSFPEPERVQLAEMFVSGKQVASAAMIFFPKYSSLSTSSIKTFFINSSPPGQNGRYFPDDIFKCIRISLKFDPTGPINNIPALVQIMAWCRSGDTPLSEPMLT